MKSLDFRTATVTDVPLLTRMNQHLREDEHSRYQITLAALQQRMADLLAADYSAIIFEINQQPIAYALFRPTESGVHLRQFFVERDYRRQGIGQAAMQILLTQVWPPQARITLDVLVHNQTGYDFWQSLGFQDYAISLERLPDTTN